MPNINRGHQSEQVSSHACFTCGSIAGSLRDRMILQVLFFQATPLNKRLEFDVGRLFVQTVRQTVSNRTFRMVLFELLAGLSNERVQQKNETRTRCIMILFFQLVIGSTLVELLAMSFFLEKGQQQILTFFSGKL